MSRLGISLEEVAKAAVYLESQGEMPTIDKVRTYLGGTGSNTTISKYLQTWRQSKSANVSIEKNATSLPPETVQVAVQQVWQQMREQSDAEIAVIKQEAENQIITAEKKAEHADTLLTALNLEHIDLQKEHKRQSAEKELLILDLKALRKEHDLLQERYHALNERYIDMQGLTSQHIKDLAEAHQDEVSRLDEKSKLQEASYQKFINELKEQHENERQQHMLIMDNLRVENQKQSISIGSLEEKTKEKAIHIATLEANFNHISVAHDENLKRLAEQDKHLTKFYDKSLVPDNILTKIYDVPTLDLMLDKLKSVLSESLNENFKELNKQIMSLKRQQTESQDG